VNINKHSFAKSIGVLGTAGISALLAVFYGCSSSSNPPAGVQGNDASEEIDSSIDSTSTEDTGSTTSDSGTQPDVAVGVADAAPDADAGLVGIAQKVTQTNLFADTDGGALHTDPNLVNAWGLAFNPTGTAWVSANGPGLLTLYKTSSPTPVELRVTVPVAAAYAPFSSVSASPSGQIFNSLLVDGGPFRGDLFIASTELGSIVGWNAGLGIDAGSSTAASRVDNTADASAATIAAYKGLTIVPASTPFLLAANFNQHRIDAFDTNYAPIAAVSGKWTDPSVPAGYAPFNVAALGTNVYVAYAVIETADSGAPSDLSGGPVDDLSGPGNGAVSVFDFSGNLVKSLIPSGAGSPLDSPWALTLVGSSGWGAFPAGTLLVGNFGDGTIHAFNATTGALVGTIVTSSGTPLAIDGLWALTWGPNAPEAGTTPDQLYFTAGPNDESDGLYGYLTAQ
jgi:uncharacterized protein (TIGR03118 family)